ncbi:MAG: hypothetical protein FJ405_19855 [Verrucomicrobia bacterium]|nr:hypothetical protein [Verrucomicrobiota bacterium]
MNCDISHLLERWNYRPGDVMVRKFTGKDGRVKLQLRVDLGILQMNVEGRPDGKRPNGHASFFDYLTNKLEQHIASSGTDESFKLAPEECARLHLEAMQFHHRYICLLQLEEYNAVQQDCLRNLGVFDFIERYAANPGLSWPLQQFRPQLLMILARARATPLLRKRRDEKAITEIEAAIDALNQFYAAAERPDLRDQSIEVESLQNWITDIRNSGPLRKRMTRKQSLEVQLSEAVKMEDYERAARVRDKIKGLKSKAKPQ